MSFLKVNPPLPLGKGGWVSNFELLRLPGMELKTTVARGFCPRAIVVAKIGLI